MYETLLLISQAVKAGVPLATAIRLTVGQQPERGQVAFLRLAELLDKGIEPKAAAAQSGLPGHVVDLFDTAFGSGDFAGTFTELASIEIRRSLVIHHIVQALAYPILLLVSTVLLLLLCLITLAPLFEGIFRDFDTALPAMTMVVIHLSYMVRTPVGLLAFGVFVALLYVAGKWLFPRFWFCVPVFGHVGRCLYSTRLLRQMANQVARNVPLPEALEQCGKTMRNSAYRNDCRSAAAAARGGMSFAEIVLRYYWLFPAWLAPIVVADTVEETLSRSLRRAADTVEQQQDASMLLLQTISLPLFIMVIFSTLSFFVMAMFMPLVSLITCLSA
jgi:type IV pilus assembly protein PilC